MAETAATTRPRRSRAAASTTAAKPAPAKAAAKPAVAKPTKEVTEVTRFTVELEHGGTTKSYEKFIVPDAYKGTVVGSIYAPIGTERVGIVVIGAEDTAETDSAE